MPLSNLGLGLLFTARDQASQSVVGLTKNVKGLETQTTGASRALQAGIGGAAAIAIGTSLGRVVDQAADFEFGLAEVKNIAGATASEMNVLRDAAFEAGLKTQFSPTQAVEGLRNLSAAGFKASKSAELLERSLILAQAGQISVGQATASVATAIKLFNLQGKEQTTIVDKMLKTTNMFKIQAGDLENGLAKTAAAALLTNQSVDEMLLTVGLIKNVFPDAGEAGNSVSRAMQSLAQKSDKVKKQFGVDVLNSEGAFKPALDLFLEIDAASAKSFPNTAKRAKALSKLFGAFGVKGFAAATGSIKEFATSNELTLKEAAKQLRGSIAGAEGTADSFLAGLNATFKGQKIILEGAIQTLAVAVGEPLLKILQPAVKTAAEAVSNVARAIKNADPVVKALFGRVALLASGLLTLGGVIGVIKASMFILVPVIKASVVGFVSMTLAAAPLILLVGALGAAFLGLSDGFQSTDSAMGTLTSTADGFLTALKAIGQVLVRGKLSDTLRDELEEAGSSGTLTMVSGLKSIRAAFLGFFKGIRKEFSQIGPALIPVIKSLGSAFMGLGRALGLVSDQSDQASDSMPNATAFRAGAVAARAFGYALEAVVRIMASVIRFGTDIVTGIRTAFSGAGPVVEAFTRSLGTLAHNLGITSKAALTGGEAGSTFGESLGNAIGRILILGVELATVMVDAITVVVAAFKSMMPVIKPIFKFLADHIEIIAALMIGRMAFSIGVTAVTALMSFGTAAINATLNAASLFSVFKGAAMNTIRAGVFSIALRFQTLAFWVNTTNNRLVLTLRSFALMAAQAVRAAIAGMIGLVTKLAGAGASAATSFGNMASNAASFAGAGGGVAGMVGKIARVGSALTLAAGAGYALGTALDRAFDISGTLADGLVGITKKATNTEDLLIRVYGEKRLAAMGIETPAAKAQKRASDRASGSKGIKDLSPEQLVEYRAEALRLSAVAGAERTKAMATGGLVPGSGPDAGTEQKALLARTAKATEIQAIEMAKFQASMAALDPGQFVIEMDGERLGRAVQRANRENQADGYQPVSTGDDI
jgi:TP901 family phage tail tape measure protein